MFAYLFQSKLSIPPLARTHWWQKLVSTGRNFVNKKKDNPHTIRISLQNGNRIHRCLSDLTQDSLVVLTACAYIILERKNQISFIGKLGEEGQTR